MHRKKTATILVIIGLLIAYVLQMAPSPLLTVLRTEFAIGHNDALLNMSISIIFPFIILGSILGGRFTTKMSLERFYLISLIILTISDLLNYVAFSYSMLLVGRALYGFGFGVSIPFIGSAIMDWYTPRQREWMNTVNSLFPFVGTSISFAVTVPLYQVFADSWKSALGIWGFGLLLILLLWFVLIIRTQKRRSTQNTAQLKTEPHIYRNLWARKDIRMLCIIFMCDFLCYSYLSIVVPTFLLEAGGMSESRAGLWAAVSLPAFCMAGCLMGTLISMRSHRRKPVLASAQLIKTAGLLMAILFSNTSIAWSIFGFAVYSIAAGMWMPVMYNIPMELPNMNPERTGATFAFISSCGFACGFIAPTIGGWLTSFIMNSSSAIGETAQHVAGLQWSIILFAMFNILAFICARQVTETGSGLAK